MKRFQPIDLSLVLSLATVIGMAMAVAGRWLPSEALGILELPGLVIVYLAGGLPTAWRALSALWRKHMLDIDLLMIAAAIAAAVVGAPFEGAVLLTLFSISTTLEERALGRVPIPTKPPLCSTMIAPPVSEMISPPGARALLALIVVISYASCVKLFAAAFAAGFLPLDRCDGRCEPGDPGLRRRR